MNKNQVIKVSNEAEFQQALQYWESQGWSCVNYKYDPKFPCLGYVNNAFGMWAVPMGAEVNRNNLKMKILILIGDGPESEDELSMYSYNTKRVSKTPKVYKTFQPINPAKNFDDWMNHIHSSSQSLSREWRTHYNH